MPLRALLVEDNPTIRDTLIPAMREMANIDVIGVAETSTDAINTARDIGEWELMVLDMFLRSGSGLQVLEALGPHEGREIVVLTNYPTADIRQRCAALGANAVYDKSTELDAFFDYCIEFRHNARNESRLRS